MRIEHRDFRRNPLTRAEIARLSKEGAAHSREKMKAILKAIEENKKAPKSDTKY